MCTHSQQLFFSAHGVHHFYFVPGTCCALLIVFLSPWKAWILFYFLLRGSCYLLEGWIKNGVGTRGILSGLHSTPLCFQFQAVFHPTINLFSNCCVQFFLCNAVCLSNFFPPSSWLASFSLKAESFLQCTWSIIFWLFASLFFPRGEYWCLGASLILSNMVFSAACCGKIICLLAEKCQKQLFFCTQENTWE